MRKYKNFNIPMIKKHLKALEEYINKINFDELSENEQRFFMDIIQFYEDVLSQKELIPYFEIDDETNLLDIRNFNNEYLKNIQRYIPIYENFNTELYDSIEKYDLIDKYFELIEYPISDTAYTNKHVLSMIHDFYESIPDKEIQDIFQKEFNKKSQNVRFTDLNSMTFYSKMIDYNFITIGNKNNFEKLSSLAHEYGHIIHDRIIKEYVDYEDGYPFVELFSYFMETLSLYYFYNKGNDKRSSLILLKALIETYDSSYNILVLDDTKNIKLNTPEDIKNFYLQEFGDIFLENNSNICVNYYHNYTLPYIIIIELLQEYNNDPESAIYKLKQIIKLRNCDYIKETQKIGIEFNKNTDKYVKQLNKKLEDSFYN